MTELPRVSISLPPDVETTIARMRSVPKFSRMPMSKVCLFLIRLGMERKQDWTRFYEDGDGDEADASGRPEAGRKTPSNGG